MSENQLEVIIKESGLAPAKAEVMLNQFKDYFKIAAEWEQKAKMIVVKDESQTVDMEMARTGRLFLREKRIAIEKTRKDLKEQSLREGKAIDGIANVLKALIVPIEEYLENQEKFVEKQEEAKREAMRLEIEKRLAEEEAAKARALAEEQERIRIENEKLKKEAAEREAKIIKERKEQEAILAKERAKAELEKKAIEAKARLEREAAEKKALAEKSKLEAEKRIAEEKARKEKEKAAAKLEAEREEKRKLEELLKNTIECPHCHKKFVLNQKG